MPEVQMQPVRSSMISAIGYSIDRQILRVEFKNKAIYEYSDVPHETYLSLMSSGSAGKYFHANIKNSYQAFRVA